MTSANSAFCVPNGVPASLDFDQCSPRSAETAIFACPSAFTKPRYMVLFAPAATDGSLPGLMLWASGTVRTDQLKPLSVETATPGLLTPFASMQFSLGT